MIQFLGFSVLGSIRPQPPPAPQLITGPDSSRNSASPRNLPPSHDLHRRNSPPTPTTAGKPTRTIRLPLVHAPRPATTAAAAPQHGRFVQQEGPAGQLRDTQSVQQRRSEQAKICQSGRRMLQGLQRGVRGCPSQGRLARGQRHFPRGQEGQVDQLT